MGEIRKRLKVARAALRGHAIISDVDITYGEVEIKRDRASVFGTSIERAHIFTTHPMKFVISRDAEFTDNEGPGIAEVVRK
jgi:hypothetical protein